MELIDRIRIIFEDESIVVVDKPSGLLTMATDTERAKTVYAALRAHLNGSPESARKVVNFHGPSEKLGQNAPGSTKGPAARPLTP